MEIERAKQAVLGGRKEPFTTATDKEGPILYRPLMAPCLVDAFAEVERINDTRIVAVGVSTRIFTEMRKFDLNILDIESEATLLRAGLVATLWGSMVLSFSPAELGDDELVFIDEEGRVTRFEIAEGYPREVKIEVRVQVDSGEVVQRTVVVPFAEVEHLDKLLEARFPGVVAQALMEGVRRR